MSIILVLKLFVAICWSGDVVEVEEMGTQGHLKIYAAGLHLCSITPKL